MTASELTWISSSDAGRATEMRSVVLLDLDGTLIPNREAFRVASAGVLDDFVGGGRGHEPVTADHSAVDDLLMRAERRWRDSSLHQQPESLGVSSWDAMWSDPEHQDPATSPTATSYAVAVWCDILKSAGADPTAAAAAAQRLITCREALVQPHPGIIETLELLITGHRLWMVTHGSTGHQRRKLRLAALDQYAERLFTSSSVGHLKGEPEFAALIAGEAEAARMVIHFVIGDSVADMELARHGPWPVIQIRPTCSETGTDRRFKADLDGNWGEADWSRPHRDLPWPQVHRLCNPRERFVPVPERPPHLFDLENDFLHHCEDLERALSAAAIGLLDPALSVGDVSFYQAILYLRETGVIQDDDAMTYGEVLRMRVAILFGSGSRVPTWREIEKSLTTLEVLRARLEARVSAFGVGEGL